MYLFTGSYPLFRMPPLSKRCQRMFFGLLQTEGFFKENLLKVVFLIKRRTGRCEQIEMVSLEDLVPQTHHSRRFIAIWSFKFVEKQLKKIETNHPH